MVQLAQKSDYRLMRSTGYTQGRETMYLIIEEAPTLACGYVIYVYIQILETADKTFCVVIQPIGTHFRTYLCILLGNSNIRHRACNNTPST